MGALWTGQAILRALSVTTLLVATGVFALTGVQSALSSPTPAIVLDPASLKLDASPGTAFTVDVLIQDVTDLGAFEFEVLVDPDFVEIVDLRLGPFLSSTQRPVTCRENMVSQAIANFGCNSTASAPPGASGSGVIASIAFLVRGRSIGETTLRLGSCGAADVLGIAIVANVCKDSKLTINPPAPTATPQTRMQKLPPLQNLFLTRQGEKIPPVQCVGPQGGENVALLVEALSTAITSPDPKGSGASQQLGAFEFEVLYDQSKVCVELEPGPAAAGMTCFVQDDVTEPVLEGVARMGCVTAGKDGPFPDTTKAEGRHLANVLVRPQPDVYSQAKPNQGNGVVLQLLNSKCELADLQGHPIKIFSCDNADVTIRYLEADVEPDCVVNTLDTQAIGFRWGASKGSMLFLDRFNLEPAGAQADDDIDIKDLQFVYGRIGSTCATPHPSQGPVNPKGGPTSTPTPTPTPPDSSKPRINKSPDIQDLLLSSPPATGQCQDGQDATSFQVVIKDPILKPDPKDPDRLQQLGAFQFETRFDPSVVCIEVAPGDIPQGEMNCFATEGSDAVVFGCNTISKNSPPSPQPPGILAVITVRPQPDVYALLIPGTGEKIITQLLNVECGLADLLGHTITDSGCSGATISIQYP